MFIFMSTNIQLNFTVPAAHNSPIIFFLFFSHFGVMLWQTHAKYMVIWWTFFIFTTTVVENWLSWTNFEVHSDSRSHSLETKWHFFYSSSFWLYNQPERVQQNAAIQLTSFIKWQCHFTYEASVFTLFTFLRHFTCTEVFNELFICPVSSASTWKINKIRHTWLLYVHQILCVVFYFFIPLQSTKNCLKQMFHFSEHAQFKFMVYGLYRACTKSRYKHSWDN